MYSFRFVMSWTRIGLDEYSLMIVASKSLTTSPQLQPDFSRRNSGSLVYVHRGRVLQVRRGDHAGPRDLRRANEVRPYSTGARAECVDRGASADPRPGQHVPHREGTASDASHGQQRTGYGARD